MDDVQRSRIRLQHWIDHNVDHLKGYSEVAQLIEQQGLSEAASRIREGIRLTEAANTEFQTALEGLPGPSGDTAGESCECGHDHHHKHNE